VVAALSGGGAKASAHIGAFRALEEAELVPSHLVGTSMGGVFAALFACGLSAKDALQRVASVGEHEIVSGDPFAFIKGLYAKSLLRGAPFRVALEKMIPARKFSELKIPLTVTATELSTGALALFGAGGKDVPLIDALCAGSALPVFLPPVEINGKRYADGGLRAVLPLEPALLFPARMVVAVDVGSGFDEGPGTGSDLPSLVQTHADAMGILMAGQTAQALALWRSNPNRPPLLYVRPRVEKGATFKVDQVRRFVEEGYSATRAVLSGLNSADGVAD
jgi:NTE family protein